MLLKDRLDALEAEVRKHAPAGTFDVLDRAAEAMRQSGRLEQVPKVGEPAPLVRLPRLKGEELDLAELGQQGHLVIAFFQGGWCPYCMTQLAALAQIHDELRSLGVSLVAVAPQVANHPAELWELPFPILIDVGNSFAEVWGLTFEVVGELRDLYQTFSVELPLHNGEDSWTLPMPGCFLLEAGGPVRARWVYEDDRLRAEPTEILQEARALGPKKTPGSFQQTSI